MSKITFRAADDLVEGLEALDTSKSEAMREALRAYLDGADRDADPDGASDRTTDDGSASGDDRDADHRTNAVDEAIRDRVDELVADRLDELLARGDAVEPLGRRPARDLNVNVTVDGAKATRSDERGADSDRVSTDGDRKTRDEPEPTATGSKPCEKCGERVDAEHVYCPNCGEKASHRVFCECGDELRSDWAFCPSCGRRTSAADVLERT
jgi:hypothetical protein